MSTTEANPNSRTDRKRKNPALGADGTIPYHNYKQAHSRTNNPKRGGPGILFTCETGREFKARREGLEILQQDWERSMTSGIDKSRIDRLDSASGTNEAAKSTLEQELATLRKDSFKTQSPSSDTPFVLYETGCKGVVVMLFQPPAENNSVVFTKSTTTPCSSDRHAKDCVAIPASICGIGDSPMVTACDISGDHCVNLWDPVLAVQRIAHDMTEKAPVYTSSRFITRMIPVQITCYATIDDIVTAVEALLQPIVALQSRSTSSDEPTVDSSLPATISHTFAIHEKRRFCSQMKREPLISAVGNMVGKVTKENPWTVQLTNPDYTIWIEICKTLAGISILPATHMHPRNFNMVEWRLSLDPNSNSVDIEGKDIASKSAPIEAPPRE